jgi:hypothetical protein
MISHEEYDGNREVLQSSGAGYQSNVHEFISTGERRRINLKNYLSKELPTICLPGALKTNTPSRQLARAFIYKHLNLQMNLLVAMQGIDKKV